MEFLNKVEIKGVVGATSKLPLSEGKTQVRFSVVTDYAYKTNNGVAVVETQWFYCVAITDMEISKGDKVHVIGRLRTRRYTDNTEERTVTEVVVHNVELIEKAEGQK